MKTEKELTAEVSYEEMAQYEEIAKELAVKYKVSKVHVYIGIDPNTKARIVGYLKEPSYLQKLMALDKMNQIGAMSAGDELRQAITLTEESDPLTYGNTSDCDAYKIGMIGKCIPLIQVIQDSFKKK